MTDVEIISQKISLEHLKDVAKQGFGDMVKAVADIEKGLMAVGGELHADEEAMLLDQGSQQRNLWGFNIYVDQPRESWLEFDSMINLRPSQGNLSRNVEAEEIRKQIIEIVNKLIQ